MTAQMDFGCGFRWPNRRLISFEVRPNCLPILGNACRDSARSAGGGRNGPRAPSPAIAEFKAKQAQPYAHLAVKLKKSPLDASGGDVRAMAPTRIKLEN
jgi:hypothetical protein